MPAKGLSLTQKVIEIVGSSIFTKGSGSAIAGRQMVSPISRSVKPDTATMSPTSARSAFTRFNPSNSNRPASRAGAETKAESYTQRMAIWPASMRPRSMRPTPMRPT